MELKLIIIDNSQNWNYTDSDPLLDSVPLLDSDPLMDLDPLLELFPLLVMDPLLHHVVIKPLD